jgi:hypothetical protein
MMKVFNLTDVETPRLKQRGLLNQTVVVGGKAVAPGASADFDGTPWERASAQHAANVGAISVDALPGSYTTAKASPKATTAPPAKGPGAEIPTTRIDPATVQAEVDRMQAAGSPPSKRPKA